MVRKRSREVEAPNAIRADFEGHSGVPDADGWVHVFIKEAPASDVWVQIESARGVPAITGLRIERRRMSPWLGPDTAAPAECVITTDFLRRLPLRLLREVGAPAARGHAIQATAEFRHVRRERQGRAWSDDHYEQVAAVYRSAVDAGRSPLQEIRETWNVSKPTASKWVAGARERQILGYPSAPGFAGYDAPRSPIADKGGSPSS